MQYRKHEVDLIFLQETHSKKDSERQWKNEWGGEMIISDGSSNSCGVAILFKKGFDCTVFSKFDDPLGRYLTLKVVIKDKLYVLINIYPLSKNILRKNNSLVSKDLLTVNGKLYCDFTGTRNQ